MQPRARWRGVLPLCLILCVWCCTAYGSVHPVWLDGAPEVYLPNMYNSHDEVLWDGPLVLLEEELREQPQQQPDTRRISQPKEKAIIPPWQDPLFVIWVNPLNNESLEHDWIDEYVLARVGSAYEWSGTAPDCICRWKGRLSKFILRLVIWICCGMVSGRSMSSM